ncbi:MAG: DUF6173 family protein [Pseudomonadota bacterium]
MSTEYKIGAKLRTEPVFPQAGVIRTDCDAGDCAERQPLPAVMAATPQEDKSPAQWAYERLILYIQKFEEGLDAEQEVGMGFAGSEAGMLHIQGMGFFAPDVITFYGVDQGGARTQLVQHVSQLNVMLKAAPKLTEKPTRIGFQMRRELEEQDTARQDAMPPEDQTG